MRRSDLGLVISFFYGPWLLFSAGVQISLTVTIPLITYDISYRNLESLGKQNLHNLNSIDKNWKKANFRHVYQCPHLSSLLCRTVKYLSPMKRVKSIYLLNQNRLSYYSLVALIFTPWANLFLFGWIVSTTGKFTHNIKGLSNILSHSSCYGLWALLRALSRQKYYYRPYANMAAFILFFCSFLK